jgi:hypothetical protein
MTVLLRSTFRPLARQKSAKSAKSADKKHPEITQIFADYGIHDRAMGHRYEKIQASRQGAKTPDRKKTSRFRTLIY